MFFQLIYLHRPDPALSELDILQTLGNFKDNRRTFRDSWTWIGSSGRIPSTSYYVEAPEEAATILKLKGYWVHVLDKEPPELDGV